MNSETPIAAAAETPRRELDDGGPAFPLPICAITGAADWNKSGGISMRDYFAAKAIPILTADAIKRAENKSMDPKFRTGLDDAEWDDGPSTFAEGIASEAYIIADAMLAARKSVTP